MYHFDKIIDRRGTDTVKYGRLKSLFGREDLIPLWVADMDFETPPFIRRLLSEDLNIHIWLYNASRLILEIHNRLAVCPSRMACRARMACIHSGDCQRNWTGCERIHKTGDSVIIQPPFTILSAWSPNITAGRCSTIPLIWDGKRYHMDFIHLESLLKKSILSLAAAFESSQPGRLHMEQRHIERTGRPVCEIQCTGRIR